MTSLIVPSSRLALVRNAPGIALSCAVAVAAFFAEPALAGLIRALTGTVYVLPNMVIALVLGIVLNGVALKPQFTPGITWCVKKLLRIAIALLGLRIALGDIIGLGLGTALLVVTSMVLTVMSGFWFAWLLGREAGYGALAGAATAVCGASATLATTTVVPPYPNKDADTAFTVVAANAVSTLVMIAYPPLCALLGLGSTATGVLLGATIHDMAQVVGAGYAVSEPVGNTALIVKLFRVFLLLPAVLLIGWWFVRGSGKAGAQRASVPLPVFALVFVALALVNSVLPLSPVLMPLYGPVKAGLGEISRWGLLIAIAALGLGTSPTAILRIGWRHVLVFCGTTVVLLGVVTGGLLILK